MEQSTAQAGNPLSTDRAGVSVSRSGERLGWLQGGFYFLFALEWFVLGSVFWAVIVLFRSFPGIQNNVVNGTWCSIGLIAGLWGTVYFVLAWNAVGRRGWHQIYPLLGIATASGIVLLGVVLLGVARTIVHEPFLLDVTPYYASLPQPVEAEASVAEGDAENGKKWFGMSCASCHGPTGEGMANNAPSLRASDFLKAADNLTVAALIRTGRTATDPANKTGKVMPARGGNPFLEESKIADLAAFLKNIETVAATEAADSSDTSDLTPPVQLSQWVVPESSKDAGGFEQPDRGDAGADTLIGFVPSPRRSADRRFQASMGGVFLLSSSVLAFHFLWVCGLVLAAAIPKRANIAGYGPIRLMRQSLFFWVVGMLWLVVWFVVFVLVR